MESVKTLYMDRQRATAVTSQCPGDLCFPTESFCPEATVNAILVKSRFFLVTYLMLNIFISGVQFLCFFVLSEALAFNFEICFVSAHSALVDVIHVC